MTQRHAEENTQIPLSKWLAPECAPTERGAKFLLKVRPNGGDIHILEGHVTEEGRLWVPCIAFHRNDPRLIGVIPLEGAA